MNSNINFLDKEYEKIIDNVVKENINIFNYMYKFNDFIYKVITKFEDQKNTNENLYIFPSFLLFSKYYQSCVIMIKHGLYESAETLLRNIIEIHVNIKYVIKDKNNYHKIVHKHLKKQLNVIKCIEKNNLYNIIPKRRLDKIKQEYKQYLSEYERKNIKFQPNFKVLCNKLNMMDEYIYYSYSCNYSHNSVGVLENLIINGKEEVVLNISPNYDDISGICARLIGVSELILSEILEYYCLNQLKEEYNYLIKESNIIF